MSSFAPFLNEEADTRILLMLRKQLKCLNRKMSSRTVDTDVEVLVIPVVQQLGVDELWGWQKSLAIYRWYEIKLSCFFLIHSQGAIKHPLSLVLEDGGYASSCN